MVEQVTLDVAEQRNAMLALEDYGVSEADRAAFLAGHAAGWRGRSRRDQEPERGGVVRAVFPDDASAGAAAGRVFQRRDDWGGSPRRWYPITPQENPTWPMSWAELLLSGAEITELVDGGQTWPSSRT